MTDPACHAPGDTQKGRAKALILEVLGVRRVAAWCEVSEGAVYQWLSRGTDIEPIPPSRVAAIVNGARAEGLDAPIGTLWPAMAPPPAIVGEAAE